MLFVLVRQYDYKRVFLYPRECLLPGQQPYQSIIASTLDRSGVTQHEIFCLDISTYLVKALFFGPSGHLLSMPYSFDKSRYLESTQSIN